MLLRWERLVWHLVARGVVVGVQEGLVEGGKVGEALLGALRHGGWWRPDFLNGLCKVDLWARGGVGSFWSVRRFRNSILALKPLMFGLILTDAQLTVMCA